jgi:hypothetical protein
MPDLDFHVEGVSVTTFAATPTLAFKLQIVDAAGEALIHSVVLRCQIQIAATRRRYEAAEQERLADLFGEPDRWSQTLRSMLWTHASVVVPPFSAETTVELPVACTFDFNIAATKYFYALETGDVPLLFLFSGTVFYAAGDDALQVTQISWNKEAAFRLPVATWKRMMEHYYPNSAWLNLRQDVFDRLYRFKIARGLPTWEQALESLLAEAGADETAAASATKKERFGEASPPQDTLS